MNLISCSYPEPARAARDKVPGTPRVQLPAPGRNIICEKCECRVCCSSGMRCETRAFFQCLLVPKLVIPEAGRGRMGGLCSLRGVKSKANPMGAGWEGSTITFLSSGLHRSFIFGGEIAPKRRLKAFARKQRLNPGTEKYQLGWKKKANGNQMRFPVSGGALTVAFQRPPRAPGAAAAL